MCQKGIIQQDQYNQIFPEEGGYSDMNNWDDHLLQMFATNVCLGLKHDTIAAIKVVKQIRNEMLAHKGSAEMETGEFLKTWYKLLSATEVVVKEEVPQMSREWTDKCESLNRDPFDISGAIGILIEYYSKETSEFNSVRDAIQDIHRTMEIENLQRVEENRCNKEQLAQLRKGQNDIAEALQKLVGEKKDIHRYTVTIDVECIEVNIHVASENEESKENTERAIRFSIQSALEGRNTEIKIKTVSKLLEGITKDGSKVESVTSGSVLLRVKCFSIKGITKLMLYMGSQELRNTMKEMEEEIGNDVELGCDISDQSIQSIMHDLARIQDTYDGNKPLVCSIIGIDNDETKTEVFVDKISSEQEIDLDVKTLNTCLDDGNKPLVCSIIDIDNDETKTEVFVDNISSEQEMELDVKIPVFEQIQTFDLSCPDDTEHCIITSCTALPTGAIVLCDGNNKNIKLYDKHCGYRSMFRFPNYPFDSCLSADDITEVLVTIPIERLIYRFSVGDEMAMKGTIDLYHDCYCITSCKLGIAVLVFDENWEVHILQYDGLLVKRLCIALSRPIGMTSILDRTQLVISDERLQSLKSVDVHTGEVVFTYKNEELEYPGRVTSDNEDNIYVEDRGTNKVIKFACLGKKIGDILTYVEGLDWPIGSEYNRYNDTIISQPNWNENKMCVYKLLK